MRNARNMELFAADGRGRRKTDVPLTFSLGKLFRARPHREAARRLYVAIVDQARQPAFYTDCGVPDTPTGRFDLIALHGFLAMRRLNSAGARDVARAVAEVVVDDLDRNLREMGVGDLSVGRKVKKLTRGFYGRIQAYDVALDAEDGLLAGALQRNLFGGVAPADSQMAAIIGYVRREATALASQHPADLARGIIEFGAPPITGLPQAGEGDDRERRPY